jgi:hypothetical protein
LTETPLTTLRMFPAASAVASATSPSNENESA